MNPMEIADDSNDSLTLPGGLLDFRLILASLLFSEGSMFLDMLSHVESFHVEVNRHLTSTVSKNLTTKSGFGSMVFIS